MKNASFNRPVWFDAVTTMAMVATLIGIVGGSIVSAVFFIYAAFMVLIHA